MEASTFAHNCVQDELAHQGLAPARDVAEASVVTRSSSDDCALRASDALFGEPLGSITEIGGTRDGVPAAATPEPAHANGNGKSAATSPAMPRRNTQPDTARWHRPSVPQDVAAAMRALSGLSIALDGKIGVGKSALGRFLARLAATLGIDAHFSRESRHERLLDMYVRDPRYFGFAFQLVMCTDAVNRSVTCNLLAARGSLSLMERSPFGNRIFARLNFRDGNIVAKDYEFYERMLPLSLFESLHVYLHVSHSVALRRMGIRGDPAEAGYDAAYLARNDDAHFREVLWALSQGAPVVPVPWDSEVNVDAHHDDNVFALVRYVDAIAGRGASLRFTIKHGSDRDLAINGAAHTWEHIQRWCCSDDAAPGELSQIYAPRQTAPPRKSPLSTRWHSANPCAHVALRQEPTIFSWDIYADPNRSADPEAPIDRECFQYALMCSISNLEDVVLVVPTGVSTLLP